MPIHTNIEWQDLSEVYPETNFRCPRCKSTHFGTHFGTHVDRETEEQIGSCHGEFFKFDTKQRVFTPVMCNFEWKRENDHLHWEMTYTLKAKRK